MGRVNKFEMENEILNEKITELTKKIEVLEIQLDENTKFYESELEKINFERFVRLNVRYIRQNGFMTFIFSVFKATSKIFKLFIKKKLRFIFDVKYKKQLKKILKEHKGKKIMVFYPGYDWYMKMYQRPQHMAIHFAQKDILFFYCTLNINDNVDGFVNIEKNLFVTNKFELLKKCLPKYTLYMCANMNGCYLKELKQIEKKGNDVLYEYIDDLHEDLTSVSNEMIERHKYVLSNEKIPVVATSKHLYDKALKFRKKNIILSTNGVVYEDFHITGKLKTPDDIKNIVKQNKPIIGYYGALAKWFDYELIEKLAKERPDYNILLIGINYDNSILKYNNFEHLKNVYYIGPVDYKSLVNYGSCCNVLTIPFVINEITLATSPVKVFEYMSMEKPIVTTDLPECRRYKSVIISHNHDEFIRNIDLALKKEHDEDYKKILRKEAKENTWDSKVKEILWLINKGETNER